MMKDFVYFSAFWTLLFAIGFMLTGSVVMALVVNATVYCLLLLITRTIFKYTFRQ